MVPLERAVGLVPSRSFRQPIGEPKEEQPRRKGNDRGNPLPDVERTEDFRYAGEAALEVNAKEAGGDQRSTNPE
jgi:hypothetical protein